MKMLSMSYEPCHMIIYILIWFYTKIQLWITKKVGYKSTRQQPTAKNQETNKNTKQKHNTKQNKTLKLI